MWMRKGNAGQFSCRNLFWCFFCTLVNWPSEKHKHNNKIQKASLRQIKRPYKDVFRFHVSVHDVQWMKMFKSRTNVLGESQCKLFSLSSALVFIEQHFKISSRHEFHHNRQLILNGDAFNHFHDFGMLCFPEETNTPTRKTLFILLFVFVFLSRRCDFNVSHGAEKRNNHILQEEVIFEF